MKEPLSSVPEFETAVRDSGTGNAVGWLSQSVDLVASSQLNLVTGSPIERYIASSGLTVPLVLPGPLLNGFCSEGAAQYLVPRTSQCARPTTGADKLQKLCQAGTVLDARTYTSGFSVVTGSASARLVQLTVALTDAGGNIIPLPCQRNSTDTECMTDDMPAPRWNGVLKTCSNAVSRVSYTIAWSGDAIEAVRADVTLASTISSTDPPAMQSFALAYSTNPNVVAAVRNASIPLTMTTKATTLATDTLNTASPGVFAGTAAGMRSGNPGYVTDMPLLVRPPNSSGATGGDGKISTLPMLARSSADGGCANVDTRPLRFGQSATGGCALEVPLMPAAVPGGQKPDCVQLQAKAADVHSLGLSAGWAKEFLDYGDPSSSEASWIEIARSNDTLSTAAGTGELYCDNVPVSVAALVTWVKQGPQAYPQARIMSVQVHTSYRTVLFPCMGPDCNISSSSSGSVKEQLQRVPLHNSVSFQQASVSPQSGEAALPPTPPVCHQQSCWRDLFYPATGIFYDAATENPEATNQLAVIELIAVATAVIVVCSVVGWPREANGRVF